jgi:glycosyltransferase involved in cell wall biosynthesis
LRATSPQSAIRFLGHRNDVADLLRAADLLVSPTRYEAYGLAVHEAVCCGTPAIVSADAGVAERFPASLKHLLLDDPNDVDGLVLRLRRCLDATSAELRDAVRSFSCELRQRSWDDMAAEMVGLLNSDRQERIATRPRPVTVNA